MAQSSQSSLAIAGWGDPLRAITLFPEYAAAVSGGLKTIETRPRRCNYRGLVGIHAGARQPLKLTLIGDWCVAERFLGRGALELQHYADGVAGAPVPIPVHLGAIVAVADLVDCVPTHDTCTDPIPDDLLYTTIDGRGLYRQRVIGDPWVASNVITTDLTDQLPFGDFTLGRFGLLLDNVTPLPEPVPATGKQTVPWRVPDDVAEKVRAQLAPLFETEGEDQ